MTTSTTFFSTLTNDLTSPLQGFISATSASVIGGMRSTGVILLGIYVCFWGWSMMRGVISEPITDGVSRIVKLAVIFAIAMTAGQYSTFVSDFLWNSPDAMASLITGGDSRSKLFYLDNIFDKLNKYANSWHLYAERTGSGLGGAFPNFMALAMAWGIQAIAIILTMYAAFLYILTKMALAILIGIGPIFILGLIFEGTKKFFEAWLGQALTFVFAIILAATILNLTGSYTTELLNRLIAVEGDPSMFDAIKIIITCGLVFLLLLQVNTIASALGGGAAVSTMGAVGWSYAKIKGAATGTARIASGRALSERRSRQRQAATNARWAANARRANWQRINKWAEQVSSSPAKKSP